MTSRRLRFEVLRRDGYTCHYCGSPAPDVELHVDHVLPVSLGGTDTPDNLVTSCAPCNLGKASISPDQPLVEKVSEDALRWASAVKQAVRAQLLAQMEADDYVEQVLETWMSYRFGRAREQAPAPHNAALSIHTFHARGLPLGVILFAVKKALLSDRIGVDGKWSYAMAIAWNKLDELDAESKRIYDGTAFDREDG